MPKIPLLAWVLQVIPEGIMITALALSLGSRPLVWKKALKIGFVFAVIIYFIRFLPFTPGVHVIVLAAILGVLCIFLGKVEMKRAMVYSAISMAALVLAEFVSVYSMMSFGITNFEEMNQNTYLRILFGYPHVVILFLITLLFNKLNLSLDFLFRDRLPEEEINDNDDLTR